MKDFVKKKCKGILTISMFEAMLQGEMNSHLGYSNNDRGEKETANRRNGYSKKTLKTTVGDVPIEVPRDREGTFEPAVVPKRKRDVSDIQDKVLLDLCQYFGQKKLKDYADFFSSSFSLCCGVI